MILFILGGAFMLGLCIFIHELGHYTLGYLVGIKAEIFSIGYGKGIWKKKIGDTTWQITAIPIGGYVKFYGDQSPDKKIPGGFFNAPPLRRMIPVIGGPLFNLILGFLLLLLLHILSGPLSPIVTFPSENKETSPAVRAGLQNGDEILSIDGKKMHSFTELTQHVALSSGKTMQFEIEREGKILNKKVLPDVLPSGVSRIGLQIPGESHVQVNYASFSLWRHRIRSLFGSTPTSPRDLRALPYLKDGDLILSVEGKKISSIQGLQKILGKHHGQSVSVLVRREKLPWLAPWPTSEETVEVPTRGEFILNVTNIVDSKYKQAVADQKLYSSVPDHQSGLNFISVNGKAPISFQNLAKKYNKKSKIIMNMGERRFNAKLEAEKYGLMGFRPAMIIYGDYLEKHSSWLGTLRHSWRDFVNNIMVYPTFFKGLFSGRISFFENAAGPLRIFGAAGLVIQYGFQSYLQLFAAISIALFVINLIPFPVVDGGHLAFFLYEAIAGKPVSLKIQEIIHRFGFGILLFVGLWIMYKDLLWLVGI